MKINKNIFYTLSSLLLNSNNLNNPIDIIKKYNKIESIECDDDEFEIIEIDLYEINKDIIKNNIENVLDYKITRLPKNQGWLINYKYFNSKWAYGKENIPEFFDWEHKGCYLGRMLNDFIKPNQTIIFKNLCFQEPKNTLTSLTYNLSQPDFLLMQLFYAVFRVSFKEMLLKYLNFDWFLKCYGFEFSLGLKTSWNYSKNSKDIFGSNIIWEKEYDKLDLNVKSKYSKEMLFKKNNYNEEIIKINNELIKKVINSKELKEKILFFIEEAFNKEKLIKKYGSKYTDLFKLNEYDKNAIKYFNGWAQKLEENKFLDTKNIDLFQKKEIYKKIIKNKIIKGGYEFTFPTDDEKSKFIK